MNMRLRLVKIMLKSSLSLKKEQIEWNASQGSLVNDIKTLEEEKKSFFDKITFLEKEHVLIQEKSKELMRENQVLKEKSSLRNEEANHSSKILNDLIHSRRKSIDKSGTVIIDESTLLLMQKQPLLSLLKESPLRKLCLSQNFSINIALK